MKNRICCKFTANGFGAHIGIIFAVKVHCFSTSLYSLYGTTHWSQLFPPSRGFERIKNVVKASLSMAKDMISWKHFPYICVHRTMIRKTDKYVLQKLLKLLLKFVWFSFMRTDSVLAYTIKNLVQLFTETWC